MRKTLGIRAVFLLVSALVFVPATYPQNNRSAVSVTGNDAASCTVPDPCRTFSVALSKTNPSGEVVALTSGGYGPFTIDKPATIVAAPGIYAALVAAAGNAIFVNAGAGAKVVIRGLHIYGMGTGTTTGTAEEVHVENCVIDGFQGIGGAGINASLNVRISDTTIRRCGDAAIHIDNAVGVVKGTINRVELRDSGNGVRALSNANVTVRDSVAADCVAGFRVGDGGQLNIENSLTTNNDRGVQAQTGGTVRVSNTVATDNSIGFFNEAGSTFVSWGNNKVQGNTTDKSGTITVVTQD